MLLLLVEDESALAVPMIAALRSIDPGYEITWASTLSQAVELSEQHRFDAALVDLNLPDASHCDIAHALRRSAPELPLIALTGRRFDEVGMPLVRAGVQDYLQKGADSIYRIHQSLTLAIERERQKSQLHRRACYDDLTGTMNRAAFENRMAKAISRSVRSSSEGALILIDIDEFKTINDTLGHQAGDIVLCAVAARLKAMTRIGDTVGRFGGDEFVVLAEGLTQPTDAARVGRKLHAASCCTIIADGQEIAVSTSMGLAVFPTQSTSGPELLRLADQAMYSVKRNGKGTWAPAASAP